MKKILYFVSVVALAACARETPDSEIETMEVYSSKTTKISVNESCQSVWNAGDELSVFFDDLVNERWTYTGVDKAASGTISAPARFRATETFRRVALYPYKSDYAVTGKSISGDVNVSEPMLAALSYDSKLHFSYLSSILRINLDNPAEIVSACLKPYGQEKFATRATVNFDGDSIRCSGEGAVDSLLLTPGATNTLTFNFLPVSFSEGFFVRFQYSDSTFQYVRYTQPITFAAGNMLEMDLIVSSFSPSLVLTVDFTKEDSPFKDFPESGDPDCTERSRRDGTYYLVQDGVSYPFGFHAGYYEYPAEHKYAGVKEYGYRIASTSKMPTKMRSLLMGRDSSYVKLPYVDGKHLRKVEVWTGNGSCGSRISLDSLGKEVCATFPSGLNPGDTGVAEVDYYHRNLDQPVFLYLSGSGNMVILCCKLYYL